MSLKNISAIKRLLDKYKSKFLEFENHYLYQENHYKILYPEKMVIPNLINWDIIEEKQNNIFSGFYFFWVSKK